MKNPILDNRKPQTSVGEYLRGHLAGGVGVLRIVSAYFTVYAYEALRGELEKAGAVRFLFGDPGSVGEVDPGEKESKDFDLTERGLQPGKALQQKPLAKACAKWIKNKKVEIRTIKQANFLHGKMYHIEPSNAGADADTGTTAVVGSSNFTHRGLGFNDGANLELNLPITDAATCDSLKTWFDDIWNDEQLTEDTKQQVLDALRRLGENCSPELVYYKTLFEIFQDRLRARAEIGEQLQSVHLQDTKIWQALYQFQRDGVVGILNRLQQYNGCILADSVGLGKTYTALAVIRHYEANNKNVLVLCPKKLSENWKLYSAQYHQLGNPFEEDKFGYTILHHTDLSRYSGKSNGIDLARFNWGAFDLVVIDESHNFRNESRSARNESGEVVRHSRYERLLDDIIKAGVNTRVLMLSATPVNTSLLDLRSQIYLMTGRKEHAFNEVLGISNITRMLNAAQKQFQKWERETNARQGERQRDKRGLFSALSGDFFTMLDAVSIARSRLHVKKFYPEVVKKIGGFPEQTAAENEAPPTDLKEKLSYETLNDEIQKLNLSIYMPTNYITSEEVNKELDEEKEKLNFSQRDREKWLIGMIRMNFLKRLESAAPSLAKTLQRTIQKIDLLVGKIEEYNASHDSSQSITEDDPENDWGEGEEDEQFTINKARRPFSLKDLNLKDWLKDLHSDRDILRSVYEKVNAIDPDRDGKLAELKKRIREKLKNPTTNKEGEKNRKVLVFTAFKDTAVYLYEELTPLLKELNANYAMVAGDETRTNYGKPDFNEILTNFAPNGRGRLESTEQAEQEIDILIATDCVSEGQNLQDCDMVLNYDIHWNPVRLIQRFGRIDRIGSRNRKVRMVNFWPTNELDYYLKLKNRVEARMALVDAAATGDNHLAPAGALTEEELRKSAETDENFRDEQLRQMMQGKPPDLDDAEDGISLSDFSLDDFLMQLMNYLEQNRKKLENTPAGVYAVTDTPKQKDIQTAAAASGVIFCLRQKNPSQDNRTRGARGPLQAYFLVYVRDDGEVRYNYTHAKQTLELFGGLAREKDKPLMKLCDAFDSETDYGKNMKKYDKLLESAVAAIDREFSGQETASLLESDGAITKMSEKPRGADNFELITWLVIKDEKKV